MYKIIKCHTVYWIGCGVIHINDYMPHRELGSNKRYLTVLCKHEIVQLLIVLPSPSSYSRQTVDIYMYTVICGIIALIFQCTALLCAAGSLCTCAIRPIVGGLEHADEPH